MRFKLMVILAAVALASPGCTPVDPGFGEAVRYDLAAQTVDPDPQYPADAHQPGDHGEKAQKATERYRKGTTKAVVQQSSNAGGSGN